MKTLTLFYSLIAGAVLWSCVQNNNENSNIVEIDGHEVHYIDISDVKDTITKSLSDFVTDISYVQLETNNEALISQGKWTVGEKYLLIFIQKEGVLQFSREGKFIRRLVSVGKGPQEISSYRAAATIYGGNHLIIQSGRERSYLLHINLDTGEFLDNIPVSLKGSLMNIEVKDSTIYCAPIVGDDGAGKYFLFSQTFSGELIDTIPAPPQLLHINGADLLYRVNNTFHYRPVKNDTVFKVNHEILEPYFIFHTGKDPKDKKTKVGDISYLITADTENYFVIRRYTTTMVEEFDNGRGRTGIKTNGEVHYIFIDKKTGQASIISPSFYNDLSGQNYWYYPYTVFNSENFLMSVDAITFLQIIDRLKKDDNIIIKNREQLISISKKVTEEDNPILILGNVK